jgi:hypothetical protein
VPETPYVSSESGPDGRIGQIARPDASRMERFSGGCVAYAGAPPNELGILPFPASVVNTSARNEIAFGCGHHEARPRQRNHGCPQIDVALRPDSCDRANQNNTAWGWSPRAGSRQSRTSKGCATDALKRAPHLQGNLAHWGGDRCIIAVDFREFSGSEGKWKTGMRFRCRHPITLGGARSGQAWHRAGRGVTGGVAGQRPADYT